MQWRRIKNSSYALSAGAFIVVGWTTSALAMTTVQSKVCGDFAAPAIVSPSDGTQTKDAQIMVEGTGEPGESVVVLRNGTSQGSGMVASDGSFGFTVPLVRGGNVLVARETNECGTTKDSPAVNVTADLPLPPTPTPETPVPSKPGEPNEMPMAVPNQESIGKPITPKPAAPGFEKPEINASNKNLTVYIDTLLIEGTAQPGSLLTVYVNGKSQAQLFSSKEGTFRLRVVLKEGSNTIKVRSTLGSKTADSEEVTVTYIKRVTATLTRPLSSGQIIAAALAAGAAVVGAAIAAIGINTLIHKYGRRK